MNIIEFMLLNADGDLGDLMNILGNSDEFSTMKKKKIVNENLYLYSSHCSALIKQSRDLKELYSAHTTYPPSILCIWKISLTFQLVRIRYDAQNLQDLQFQSQQCRSRMSKCIVFFIPR